MIKKHKIPIQLYTEGEDLTICPRLELHARLEELGITEQFGEYFGIQTMMDKGPFASDVEAVLQRIYNKKLTGTQRLMD